MHLLYFIGVSRREISEELRRKGFGYAFDGGIMIKVSFIDNTL
jgi:hypothetical protein